MWEETKQGDRWFEATYQENAGDREKRTEETGWGRCFKKNQEAWRNNYRTTEESCHTETSNYTCYHNACLFILLLFCGSLFW